MQHKNDQSDKGGGGGESGQSSQMLEVLGSVGVIEVVRVGGVVRFDCNLQNLQQIDPEQQVVKQMPQFANLQNKLTICKNKKVFWNNNFREVVQIDNCKCTKKNSRMTICKKGVNNDNLQYLQKKFSGITT